MVKILGTGTTADGKEYVMVDKCEFKELLELVKKHGKNKNVLAELTGGSRKVSRNGKGTPTRIPKKLKEAFDKSFDRALGKLDLPKGVTEEDENSFYKLRSDWLNVKL